MRIRFLATARREFSEAVSYYDSREPSLGDESANEVWETISKIASHPSAWQQLSSRTRASPMPRALSNQELSVRRDMSNAAKVAFDHRCDAPEAASG